ncbi:EAL domain-containing protein [Dactylosporangium sp. CA-092794]|uniref:EAL domain-containing protein n=1 Tax=Dactylosporangium sp. CA-092794 TaxID=3239929 RepID=UPI003D936416
MSAVPSEGIAALASAWEADLPRTSFVPGGRDRRRRVLHELIEHLAAALTGPAGEPGAGQRVGQELVRNAMTDPQIMAATVRFLRQGLLDGLGLGGPGPVERLTVLLDEIALGFVTALVDHVRTAAEHNARDERAAWREYQQQVRDAANFALNHDAATGLPNRNLLIDYLDRVLAEGRSARVAVCQVAIDHPGTGAESVRQLHDMAARLRALASEREFFVAHLDDEHFVLVEEDTTGPDDAVKAADAVLRTLMPSGLAPRFRTAVRVRVGAVEQETEGATTVALLRAARTALRWAYASEGPSAWALFDPGRAADYLRRRRLADELRVAEPSGVDLVYQPILRLRDSSVAGLHARPSWCGADGVPVGAPELMELAGAAGVRPAIERKVLAAACAQAARWCDDPGPPFVSVEIGAGQLAEPGFVGAVAAVLDASGLPPGRLQLAVDDGALCRPDGDVRMVLDGLDGLGVALAANTLGAGQATLIDTPVTAVNLDPGFIEGVTPLAGRYRSATTRVAWVLDMLHDLDFTVTAVGVRNLAQYETLFDLGCDQARGDYLARPLPAAEVDRLLDRKPY